MAHLKDLIVNGDVSIGGSVLDKDHGAGTSGQFLSSTGDGINWVTAPSDNIFVAVYGTTTYAEITEALAANKEIICIYNNRIYRYTGLSTYYYFQASITTTNYYVRVSSANAWTNGSSNIANDMADHTRLPYYRPYTAAALYRYKICGVTADNRISAITLTNQSSATNVAKQTATTGFRVSRGLFFYTSTTTVNAGAAVTANTMYDRRSGTNIFTYSLNGYTATAYRDVYLEGDYDASTDLFTLANTTSAFHKLVPINSAVSNYASYFTAGKYYWFIGSIYSSNTYDQFDGHGMLYYFDGTNLVPHKAISILDSGLQSVSVNAETWSDVATLTLPAGKWLVLGNEAWSENSTGRRILSLAIPEDASNFVAIGNCAIQNATQYNICTLEKTRLVSVNAGSTTTVTLKTYHSAGSALTVQGVITAMKIA